MFDHLARALSSFILNPFFFLFRDSKGRRKQKGHQNGETSPTHNPMQPGENGIENPDFNKEVPVFHGDSF